MYREIVIPVLLFVLRLNQGHSLYFHIDESARRCFFEEIPGDTTVLATYRVELFDAESNGYISSQPDIGMFVQVKDPDDNVILSRVYNGEGRISFTSHTPGEHILCLYNDLKKGNSHLRVHFDIKVGDEAIDYAEVAKKEKFSDLQLRIRQLLDQVDYILKEQDYQRYREERFRAVSESTNKRILWWSILHVSTVVTIGLWQMRHLRKFFEAKKLV